jgi:para-aminobenzoate synthetase component I
MEMAPNPAENDVTAKLDGLWVYQLAWREPLDVARAIAERPGFAFLDSAMFEPKLGRYSFIGLEPFGIFTAVGHRAAWNGVALKAAPQEALRDLLDRFSFISDPTLPPFQGGVMGAVPYEFGWEFDGLRGGRHAVEQDEPVSLGFYDLVLAFDHLLRRAYVFSSGLPEMDDRSRAARAAARIDHLLALLEQPGRVATAPPAIRGWASNFTPAAYHAAIEDVQAHIFAGDIYQANIAQRFSARLPEDFAPFGFYEKLRAANPAPFAAYLNLGETVIASSSPELLLRKRGRAIETRPIKGTINRSPDPAKDARRAQALLKSEKDRAENIMIVDLLRNDLSRVSEPKSVEVPVLCGLESYANVHHLVSVVTGELAQDRDIVDLVAATFPGGSVTGAPKRRAMEIIDEIEKVSRGYYCGSILYIGFDGAMDMNIAIRTAVLKPGHASLHAGGGITSLSDPVAEYAETEIKVKRLFEAFGAGEELEEAAQ